jgi:hypothetical protein
VREFDEACGAINSDPCTVIALYGISLEVEKSGETGKKCTEKDSGLHLIPVSAYI